MRPKLTRTPSFRETERRRAEQPVAVSTHPLPSTAIPLPVARASSRPSGALAAVAALYLVAAKVVLDAALRSWATRAGVQLHYAAAWSLHPGQVLLDGDRWSSTLAPGDEWLSQHLARLEAP